MVEAQDTQIAANGIQFEHVDWENTLKLAKEHNKIIFVDAFTTWCGPCKLMSKNVFTQGAVGDFYNENFVNVKIDMEKGEGLLFAKAYEVKAYPTFLFIDHEGNMVHKGLGSQPAEKFIELGEAASDPDRQLGTLTRRYEAGETDPAFLKNYAEVLQAAYMQEEQSEVALLYMKSQDNWLSSENAEFILQMAGNDLEDELFRYIVANRQEMGIVVGKKEVDTKLKRAAMMEMYRKHRKQLTDRETVEMVFGKVFPDAEAKQYAGEMVISNMSGAQDEEGQQKFLEAVVKHMDQYKTSDWSTLNTFAWRVYELSDDPALLDKAKGWAKASVEQNSNYMNNDTLAALYFKLKKKDKALQHANEAIELAKKDGMDYSETEALLKQIQALQ